MGRAGGGSGWFALALKGDEDLGVEENLCFSYVILWVNCVTCILLKSIVKILEPLRKKLEDGEKYW